MGMYFGIGIEHGKNIDNAGTLWRTAENFGADFIFTVGPRYRKRVTDVYSSFKRVPLYNYRDVDDLYAHLPYGCRLIGVENSEGAADLRGFAHPDRAVYLLGAEDHGLTKKAVSMCHQIVSIPCVTGCFNVAVAAGMVMYDRLLKSPPGTAKN